MSIEKTGKSVEVVYENTARCPLRNKPPHFYHMVYIIEGTGQVSLNDTTKIYQPGYMFFFGPDDSPHFEMRIPTEFLLIRFTSDHIKDYRWKSIDHVECLLHHVTQLSDCILCGETEKFLTKRIVDSLLHTINNKVDYDEDLMIHYVNALIVITSSNILKFKPSAIKPNADKKIHDIIAYIQVNITAPEKLKASIISAAFGISEAYLSNYFKNQSGETIQHYIASYKLRMIEHRLKYSGMRINEIASEFGFTDESHLNKFFKKHHEVSLREFRKAKTAIANEATAS